MTTCWIGLFASLILVANVWPRAMLPICFACFLSLSARRRLLRLPIGRHAAGSRLPLVVPCTLRYPSRVGEQRNLPLVRRCFCFCGVVSDLLRVRLVKLESGDPTWRNLTAFMSTIRMGRYPHGFGWYLQHLPNWFHIATAAINSGDGTSLSGWPSWPPLENICFFVVTIWQIGVIATANYAFLTTSPYTRIPIAGRFVSTRFIPEVSNRLNQPPLRRAILKHLSQKAKKQRFQEKCIPSRQFGQHGQQPCLSGFIYATAVPLVQNALARTPLPTRPVTDSRALSIANAYGLFAVMTPPSL